MIGEADRDVFARRQILPILAWAGTSIALVVVGAFGTWERGRADAFQPGPHMSRRLVDGDALILLAPAIAGLALVFYVCLRERRMARLLLIVPLLAGAFMVLVVLASYSSTAISCDELFGPVCEEGEDAIRKVSWGHHLAALGALSLTIASSVLLIQTRR